MELNLRSKKEIQLDIDAVEAQMGSPDFWAEPSRAQEVIAQLEGLKAELETGDRYGVGPASVSIYAGAGGEDSEDFVRILSQMYQGFADKEGYKIDFLDEASNDTNGYKRIAFKISGLGAYGKLKGEDGVHRLVRKSPFNAKSKRHTSFALVDIDPEIKAQEFSLDESELEISYTKSGGAGGQNVNKRETAVRITHPKTGISAHVSSERSQHQNKELALELIRAKLYKKHLGDEEKRLLGHTPEEQIRIEWGNQIRSYIFDPYQMIKDHRLGIDVHQIDKVLGGDLHYFYQAIKQE
ncbi:MAG: PCRF domain-containing protein [Patescibacteria group bacterium]